MLAITSQPAFQATTGFKLSASATIIFFALVLTGPLWYGQLTGYDPYAMDISQSLAAPSLEHPLGCDRLGRDQLMRLLWGSYYSLPLAAALIVSATLLGTLLGLSAALRGGILARLSFGGCTLPSLSTRAPVPCSRKSTSEPPSSQVRAP